MKPIIDIENRRLSKIKIQQRNKSSWYIVLANTLINACISLSMFSSQPLNKSISEERFLLPCVISTLKIHWQKLTCNLLILQNARTQSKCNACRYFTKLSLTSCLRSDLLMPYWHGKCCLLFYVFHPDNITYPFPHFRQHHSINEWFY